MNINSFYSSIIQRILTDGSREVNLRTGVETAALPGVTFETDHDADGFPLLGLRKISAKAFVAEQMWFLSGSNNIRPWLTAHTKIWDAFAEEDGTVTAAYGDRWRNRFGIDQLGQVLLKLREDPTSRHGVVMMWDPWTDLVNKQKNVPCPYTFTLMIIGGRLHMHLVVRSNDMVLGFPTDAAGFALLQLAIAQELGVPPGKYTHSISNCHIYKNHYDAAELMWRREEAMRFPPSVRFELPPEWLKRAEKLEEQLFHDTVATIEAVYNPEPPISGLTIAL